MPDQLTHISIFGTPVACADYQAGFEAICRLAEVDRPAAVCASNTHIVSHARFDSSFGDVMRSFDIILPDGMPLIWYMNRRGAQLTDRVYGPYFMRYVLQHSRPQQRHFFFGGKQSTLDDLVANARELNPELNIVGTYSPPYRQWSEEDEVENARRIHESQADFIWVALGGERQERWIAANQHRHSRGVFLAVGDAFELLAGNRPFAPDWIQRSALTWLYRLLQEPRRLWSRYFRYNSLFIWYLLLEALGFKEKRITDQGLRIKDTGIPTPSGVGRRELHPEGVRPLLPPRYAVAEKGSDPATRSDPGRPKKIAFIGSRGVPAHYSGFETVVAELGRRLVQRGYEVTVYNRPGHYMERFDWHEGMRVRWFPTLNSKSLETPIHTMLSLVDAIFRRYDIIYLCGVGNAPLSRLLNWLSGAKLIINVDGADYRRAKWGPLGRFWLRRSEREAVQIADAVIADNPEIVERYEKAYGYRPELLSYGTPIGCEYQRTGVLDELGLRSKEFFLCVGRITPENEAHLAVEGYLQFLEETGDRGRKSEDRKVDIGEQRSDPPSPEGFGATEVGRRELHPEGVRPLLPPSSGSSRTVAEKGSDPDLPLEPPQGGQTPSSTTSEMGSDPVPPLVIVGGARYETAYMEQLQQLAAPAGRQILFVGGRYGDAYRELSDHALAFVLPARIEATRLVLLDQMGFGSCIIFHDCEASRHVIGEAGIPFGAGGAELDDSSQILGQLDEVGSEGAHDHQAAAAALAERMLQVVGDAALVQEKGAQARERAERLFSWEAVTDGYEGIFGKVRSDPPSSEGLLRMLSRAMWRDRGRRSEVGGQRSEIRNQKSENGNYRK